MNKIKICGWILIFFILICLPASRAMADGGYFSSESVAVSVDQRAIIIKNGDEISMTFSTGYTGEGEDFGWIIPTPVPPDINDVSEAGENGEKAFDFLDEFTAPRVITSRGCFPAGTEVLTADGPRTIETVEPETAVYSFNLSTGEWVLRKVLKRFIHYYKGDMVTIAMDQITIQATGNHPFYVLRGDQLFSRPLAQDIPKEEQQTAGRGRWVEARDLKEGDFLQNKNGEVLMVTSLSSRQEKTEVYNLNVENNHNYAVHRKGLLVHNKGGAEVSDKLSASPVTVYGTVTLEYYQVSILEAAAGSDLLNWLRKNNYQVNYEAEEVLDTYIEKNWAFVAVKLNPGKRRHYENEFLPPLTIKYQYDQLIFPLRISSISTIQTANITLYVITESTVTSSNFPTKQLIYKGNPSETADPEEYIETCIQRTVGSKGSRLALIWSGEFHTPQYPQDEIEELMSELMQTPFQSSQKIYLTRLESRMDPAVMTDDIGFISDRKPKEFGVHIYPGEKSRITAGVKAEPVWISSTPVKEGGLTIGFLFTTMVYPWRSTLPGFGLDFLWLNHDWESRDDFFIGVESNISLFLISTGLSLVWNITPTETTPYLGFRVRLLDVPPIIPVAKRLGLGFDLLPITVRWNLRTGKPLFSIGLFSVSVGISN